MCVCVCVCTTLLIQCDLFFFNFGFLSSDGCFITYFVSGLVRVMSGHVQFKLKTSRGKDHVSNLRVYKRIILKCLVQLQLAQYSAVIRIGSLVSLSGTAGIAPLKHVLAHDRMVANYAMSVLNIISIS